MNLEYRGSTFPSSTTAQSELARDAGRRVEAVAPLSPAALSTVAPMPSEITEA